MTDPVIRRATWYPRDGRALLQHRVRGVWQPARARSVLLSSDGDVVGARRLLFPDMMILSLEAGVGRHWEPVGFPSLEDASPTVMVVALDGPPRSTGARVYGVDLPSHFDNGCVCLGEGEGDARAGPEGWVEHSYWSTSYREIDFEDFDEDEDGEPVPVSQDATVGRRRAPMRLCRQHGRGRRRWLGLFGTQERNFEVVSSPTIDDAAYSVMNYDYETLWREDWYRRLELERA